MARGGYTPSEIREMSDSELYFIHHYQTLRDKKLIDALGKMLGVVWDINEIQAAENTDEDVYSDTITFPLAMVINPKIVEIVKKQKPKAKGRASTGSKFIAAGEYIPKPNENIRSMGDLSKEEFYKMINATMPSKAPSQPSQP